MRLKISVFIVITGLISQLAAQWGTDEKPDVPVPIVPTGKEIRLDKTNYAMDAGLQEIFAVAKNARVVISGENHREIEFNALLEFTLLRSLYENCGYRNFVLELSSARAYYLQKYVCENDSLAKKLLQSVSSPKYMLLFDNIRDWNMSLPEKDRINIYGIDVERFEDLSLHRVFDFIQNIEKVKKVPLKLMPQVYAIKNLATRRYLNDLRVFKSAEMDFIDKSKVDEIEVVNDSENPPVEEQYEQIGQDLRVLMDSMNKDMPKYKEWLGEEFNQFYSIYKGLLDVYQWNFLSGSAQQYLWREEQMFQNFTEILNTYPNEKFYGQFGRCHASLTKSNNDCGWFNYYSLMSKLKKNYFRDSNELVSMCILYPNRGDYLTSEDLANMGIIKAEINALNEKEINKVMIYDLNSAEGQIVELRKKFRFAIVNNKPVEELNGINDEISNVTTFTPKKPVTIKATILGFEYLSLSHAFIQDHFNVSGRTFKKPSPTILYHELFVKKGAFVTGISGFYSPLTQIYGDSIGKVNHSLYGIEIQMGGSYQFDKISLDLMFEGGFAQQTMVFNSETKNVLIPNNPEQVKVVNPVAIVGANFTVNYQINRYFYIGARGRYIQNVSTDRWVYQGSNINYLESQKNTGMSGWGLSGLLGFSFMK